MKPIQRDLAVLAMVKDYLKTDLSTLIPHLDREKLWIITEKNIPDGDTLHNVLKEMALDSYNRIKKKYSK
ncbi:hypothetical protein BC351_01135 [Paenibacillus ferrarius]|uniref:Uncharacterized protein n=1 Tax=Paenibacillus ferrarius TaxID=1469647 RepID=A0A1V4HTH2_9BACL|nr:hypothetical protein [Paenibacillus ferrarius]OPH61875.1 hypothetical protein BC351_01135 [Paenibacillus ferrarius]